MLISDLKQPIPIEAIYPDRIEIALLFHSPPFTTMQEFLHRLNRFLKARGIRIICWQRREIEFTVEIDDCPISIKLRLRCAGAGKPTYVYFSFNPIRIHNELRAANNSLPRTREKPFIAVNNWLRPSDEVSATDICMLADEVIAAVHDKMIELMDGFYGEASSIPVTSADVSIQNLELFVDIRCAGIGRSVQQFTEVFPSAFKRTRRRFYRSSEQVYGSDESVQFVEGYYRAGIRAKLYEKTDRRLRAELLFTRSALKYRRVEVNMSGSNFLLDIWPSLADLAHPIFSQFLTPLSDPGEYALRPTDIEAFAAIISKCSPEDAIRTVNRLVNTQRLTTSSLPRARRQQLLDAGIVERVDRGLMRLAPRYRNSLLRVQHALDASEEA